MKKSTKKNRNDSTQSLAKLLGASQGSMAKQIGGLCASLDKRLDEHEEALIDIMHALSTLVDAVSAMRTKPPATIPVPPVRDPVKKSCLSCFHGPFSNSNTWAQECQLCSSLSNWKSLTKKEE